VILKKMVFGGPSPKMVGKEINATVGVANSPFVIHGYFLLNDKNTPIEASFSVSKYAA